MQRNIRVACIPQVFRWRKIRHLGQCGQHFAKQASSMAPDQMTGRTARQQALDPRGGRIPVILLDLRDQLARMHRHQSLQFLTLDLTTLEQREQLAGSRNHPAMRSGGRFPQGPRAVQQGITKPAGRHPQSPFFRRPCLETWIWLLAGESQEQGNIFELLSAFFRKWLIYSMSDGRGSGLRDHVNLLICHFSGVFLTFLASTPLPL